LPRNHETIKAGRHLSRRVIPGFIYALQQMMGQETYSRHGDRTKTLVDTLHAVHGDSFTWDEVYADPTCQDVAEEVLVDIAERYGREKLAILEALLGGLQSDHADLMKAGRL
jgi:hypothetical protein